MAEVRTATRIGWIGLGKMGLPICLRLRRVGFPVSVPCRNAAAKQAATTNGFEVAHTIADAATGADIIVSAISDDKALLDIVFRAGGLKDCLAPGQVYVDISTASPDASGRVAEALELVTVKYVRAPVSGSAATAMQGADGPGVRTIGVVRHVARVLRRLHQERVSRRLRRGGALSQAGDQRHGRGDLRAIGKIADAGTNGRHGH